MEAQMRSGCPFSGSNSNNTANDLASPLREQKHNSHASPKALPTGKARVKLLYEEYIHLHWLKKVWDSPLTESPILEPSFAAGMHGIELSFLLLAEFIADSRDYVAKRPRIEKVSDDIASQCRLLVEVIDGELEEEGTQTNRLTLTQNFPFPGAPPTRSQPSYSPGLDRLESAIRAALPAMSLAEQNSLIKVVINLTSTAFGSFQRWSVGLGLEPQLNTLRSAVGLPLLDYSPKTHWLDYSAIVQPEVCLKTLTFKEKWTYHEDFFFRTVHLGTECWAKIALARLDSAKQLALEGSWHVAAARILQASRILDYLGSHVMLLTSMNLRDYLLLKVELEGTSGEGSVQVKQFRPVVASLFAPLAAALLPRPSSSAGATSGNNSSSSDLALAQALMNVYEFPDREESTTNNVTAPNASAVDTQSTSNRQLYNYAKALEDVESGLLGGFYFKHFRLASNVIGSDAKGTMRRAVQGLKTTYETPVFPILDRVRSGLGAKIDAELAHVKGRMMQEIIDSYLKKEDNDEEPVAALDVCPTVRIEKQKATTITTSSTISPILATSASNSPDTDDGSIAKGCLAPPKGAKTAEKFEMLYSMASVPSSLQSEITKSIKNYSSLLNLPESLIMYRNRSPLSFLDHAWGRIPPAALHAALVDVAALYSCGNPSWDVLYGSIMPTAAGHIRRLLGLSSAKENQPQSEAPAATADTENKEKKEADGALVDVHFGHNSHELVTRILSQLLLEKSPEDSVNSKKKVKILTTDSEFYSFTRQINRLIPTGMIEVEAVVAEPVETFASRCIDAAERAVADGNPFHFVYLSQVTALTQHVLLPDLADFVPKMNQILHNQDKIMQPLLVIDGYHSFCAMPNPLGPRSSNNNTDINSTAAGAVSQQCCFIAGLIKHAGSGANCSFITIPRHYDLHPVFTGWLSDPSVLSGSSAGIQLGSPKMWLEAEISVEKIHKYVVELQDGFLSQLASAKNLQGITIERLINGSKTSNWRSHSLVFEQETPEEATAVVERLKQNKGGGVLIDSRKQYVRIGFGPYHTVKDVQALLLQASSSGVIKRGPQ